MLRTHTSQVGELRLHHRLTRQQLKTVAKLWLRRSRTRRALAALSDYELRDIGLTRDDVRKEIAKPFWSPWPHA
jgi:uncharacterized protein YjiS (DUF1127 family)